MVGLVRPVFRRRRRWAAGVIAVAIPAHLVALYALLSRPEPTTYTTATETTNVSAVPPPPVVAPVAPPPPSVRTCPPPNRTPRNAAAPAMPAVTSVYASPTNVDWLVAWNEAAIYASVDGGSSFHEVLGGKGRVHDVAIDCFGNVIAARGSSIGIRADGRESWRMVPGVDFTETVHVNGRVESPDVWIIGGVSDVVVVGFERANQQVMTAALSRDLGRSWTAHDLAHPATDASSAGRADLVIEMHACDGAALETFTIPDAIATGDRASVVRGRATRCEADEDTSSVDAAGRAWFVGCGHPYIGITNDPLACAREDGGDE